MRSLFTLIALLLCTAAFGQNLVPDPGFESYTGCPTSINGGSYFPSSTWVSACWSPEYFNVCATSPMAGVPLNTIGYQPAWDGNGYVGILAYNDLGGDDYTEYVMTRLPALQKDTEYVVTIHVSLAIKAMNSYYAVDGFGVHFNTYGQPARATFNQNLAAVPQVDYTSFGIITDTVNWVTLTKTFVADSAYTYIVVGNFKDHNTIHKHAMMADSSSQRGYYYIDGVSVVKMSDHLVGISGTAETAKVSFYPNPMQSWAQLTFPNPGSVAHTLSLFNLQGQVVKEMGNITGTKVVIERDNLPKGVYFYELRDDLKLVGRGRFVAE